MTKYLQMKIFSQSNYYGSEPVGIHFDYDNNEVDLISALIANIKVSNIFLLT